jgi:CxxC motif-containing protein (DUF1111 family)
VHAELGGALSRPGLGADAFSLPAPRLTAEERRLFEVGDSFFTQNWVAAPASTAGRDGLGPVFNASSCASCHVRDGRGLLPVADGVLESGLLMRLSVPGTTPTGEPAPDPVYGGQFQDRSLPGVAGEGRLRITYTETTRSLADGTVYMLRTPRYELVDLAYGPLAAGVMLSPRLAPQVVGMGLLESVPADTITALADPDDRDGDGISGRANAVWDVRTASMALGRFGWKAGQPSVEQQSAGAFNGDMGLSSTLFPALDCTATQTACRAASTGGDPEVSDEQLAAVTFYGRTLAVPRMRDADRPAVARGAAQFRALGCSGCHVESLVTGDAAVPSLARQTIHPYSDLLLHDMGDGLADGRPEFAADGREWRTPPLWGLGLLDDVSGTRLLLHDGRARTLTEAIMWHGGEAQRSAQAFGALTAAQRDDLLSFLESL